MRSHKKLEGLEIVLFEVVVSILTLLTMIPTLVVMRLPSPAFELTAGFLVFAAWTVAVGAVAPLIRSHWLP